VDWDKLLDTAQGWVKQQGGNIINTTVGTITSFVGGLFNFFMALAFSIYILFDKENLKRQLRRLIHAWVPSAPGQWVIHASRVISSNFRNFVSGQTLEALILGVLCMLGMLILRIPYAPMVGTLVGVSALIPVVGAFAGAFIGAFMILTVDPFKALIFLIFLILLQWVEGNLIYPKVMGSHINLPGIWVLAAVTVGGSVAGPVGMLLGVPITAAAYCLLREATEKQEAKGRTAKKASAPSPLPPDDTASDASLPKDPPQPTEAPVPGKKSNKKSRNK
jgi:predicted PurR-regulated permease PerM